MRESRHFFPGPVPVRGLPDSESSKPGPTPLFARLALPSPDIAHWSAAGRVTIESTCLWKLSRVRPDPRGRTAAPWPSIQLAYKQDWSRIARIQSPGNEKKTQKAQTFTFWVVPRVVPSITAQNVRSSIRETRPPAHAVRLEYTNRTMLGDTVTTWGRVPVQKARAGGCALKQERVPGLGCSDVSVVCASGLLTKLRVHHGLLVANMVEGHHEGVLHAACGR